MTRLGEEELGDVPAIGSVWACFVGTIIIDIMIYCRFFIPDGGGSGVVDVVDAERGPFDVGSAGDLLDPLYWGLAAYNAVSRFTRFGFFGSGFGFGLGWLAGKGLVNNSHKLNSRL